MPTLAISSDYLTRLIVKVRGVQGREGEVDVDSGSNPTDDNAIDAIQDTEGDLSREEISAEIDGLDDRQKAELVALLWVGRGDAEIEEWEQTIELARERQSIPTSDYLLGQPLLAEYWADAADRLGIETF